MKQDRQSTGAGDDGESRGRAQPAQCRGGRQKGEPGAIVDHVKDKQSAQSQPRQIDDSDQLLSLEE